MSKQGVVGTRREKTVEDYEDRLVKQLIEKQISVPEWLMKAIIIAGAAFIASFILYNIVRGILVFNWNWNWGGWVWFVSAVVLGILFLYLGVERLAVMWKIHYIISAVNRGLKQFRRKQIKQEVKEYKLKMKHHLEETIPPAPQISKEQFTEIAVRQRADRGDGQGAGT